MKKIVGVSSYVVDGSVGLKLMTQILGTACLGVPSILLTAPKNKSKVKIVDHEFRLLLEGVLEDLKTQDEKVILFLGYLKSVEQIYMLEECIVNYRDVFECVVIDPIMGDYGKPYVDTEIIENYAVLLKYADIVIPNTTELSLLTGEAYDTLHVKTAVQKLNSDFPNVKHVVVTSYLKRDSSGVYYYGEEEHVFSYQRIPKDYSGSGDAFAAYFMKYHFLESKNITSSLSLAAAQCYALIANSFIKNFEFLKPV